MPNLRQLLSCLLLTGLSAAQTAELGHGTTVRVGHGCNLDIVDGTLTAIGDDYKATFRDGELLYTPLLGRAAPHNLPLALRVTHSGREELAAVGSATTRHDDLVASFLRPELTERIEVRPEGLKQSFVFTQLPPGNGDLVVRAQWRSELPPEAMHSSGSLRFLMPQVGGVEIGSVLGIDADGRTSPGSLRVDGDHLDFVLPAAFVRGARLPLVVDPMLSTVVVTSSTLADSTPDVAPLPSPTDAYLVVWIRAVSATDDDVRGQRVSAAGALLGGLLMIETTTANSADATVAGSHAANNWVVVWEQAGDIKARWISSTGVFQSVTDIANGQNVQLTPRLAGGSLSNTTSSVCVWHDATANQILTRRLDMQAQVAIAPAATIVSGTATVSIAGPTISRDNLFDRLLVAWTSTNLLGQRAVRGMMISPAGAPLSANVPIAGSVSAEAFAPTCSGNSEEFVVAYRTSSSIFGDGAACVPLQFTFNPTGPGAIAIGSSRNITGPNGPARSTAVAMFQGSAVVAFASTGTTGHDVRALSIDPFLCSDCEGSLAVDTAGNDTGVAICSRAFGASQTSPNEGAIVFVPIVGGQGDVSLRLLRADDGLRTQLDINCTSGHISAPCARAGNANFGLLLRGAAPNELILVIHSLGLMNFQCNPCLVGPDTTIGIVSFLGSTSPTGSIRAPLPLPGGATAVGATLHSQFVLFGGLCLGNFRVTEGVSCTLQ